jgi:glutaconate CoA-transferase subunit B
MPGAGPTRIITDKGILESDTGTGEMVLTALYPGVTVDEVKANVGWPLQSRETLGEVAPPGLEELRLLREVLDPKKLYLA